MALRTKPQADRGRNLTQGWELSVGLLAAVCAAAGEANAQAAPQQAEQPPAAASNITSYKPDFFAQFRPNTAMDMVNRLPGFSFDGGSGERGFSGTAGNVLIDGQRPPSRSESLNSIIARIPAGGVERIDVVRGGAEGIDMQGKSIVANIIRKKDAGVTGSIGGTLSMSDAGTLSPNTTLQLRSQADGQLIEGSVSLIRGEGSNDSTFERRDPAGTVLRAGQSGSESVYERIDAAGSWEAAWLGGKLRINGQASGNRLNYTGGSQFALPGGQQDSTGQEENLSGEAGVRYSRNLESGYSLALVGFQSLRTRDRDTTFARNGVIGQPDFTSGTLLASEGGESIARATLQAPKMGEWTLEGGGELVYNYSEQQNVFFFNGAAVSLEGDRFRVDELRADGFVTATWAPSPQLNVETGMRFEWSRIEADSNAGVSEKALTYLKPRVNVSWTPDEGHQWGARIERKVDQLDFASFASAAAFEEEIFGVGNPEAEPEKSWTFELRYQRQFGGQNSLSATYTHELTEDVLGRAILVVPGVPPASARIFEITRNGGEATRDMFNVKGSFELDGLGMPGGILSFGGTLTDTNLADPVTGEDHDIDNAMPWEWSVSLQQTLGNGDFRWGIFLEDDADRREWEPQYLNRFNSGPFLGANLTWKPWAGWTFGAGVNNILAQDAKAEFAFFSAPRTVGATPTYTDYDSNHQQRQFFINVRRNF